MDTWVTIAELQSRCHAAERRLHAERGEHLAELQRVQTSFKAVSTQSMYMMMVLCIQFHRNAYLQGVLGKLISTHPIVWLYFMSHVKNDL